GGDLVRIGELGRRRLGARRLQHLLFDDLLAEVDALVADVDALSRDELADLLLALAAEAAAIRDLGPLAARPAGRRRHAVAYPASFSGLGRGSIFSPTSAAPPSPPRPP